MVHFRIIPWEMCITATVKPAATSEIICWCQEYLGNHANMGNKWSKKSQTVLELNRTFLIFLPARSHNPRETANGSKTYKVDASKINKLPGCDSLDWHFINFSSKSFWFLNAFLWMQTFIVSSADAELCILYSNAIPNIVWIEPHVKRNNDSRVHYVNYCLFLLFGVRLKRQHKRLTVEI